MNRIAEIKERLAKHYLVEGLNHHDFLGDVSYLIDRIAVLEKVRVAASAIDLKLIACDPIPEKCAPCRLRYYLDAAEDRDETGD